MKCVLSGGKRIARISSTVVYYSAINLSLYVLLLRDIVFKKRTL